MKDSTRDECPFDKLTAPQPPTPHHLVTQPNGDVEEPALSHEPLLFTRHAPDDDPAPRLMLILPDDRDDEWDTTGRLSLVPKEDGAEESAPARAVLASFTEWADQASQQYCTPADTGVSENLACAENDVKRPVATDWDASLWSNRRVKETAESSAADQTAASESADIVDGALPPPPAPARIGSGRRVLRNLGWKPGNPLAGLAGPLTAFRWRLMWRAAGATAACGVVLILVLRTVFA